MPVGRLAAMPCRTDVDSDRAAVTGHLGERYPYGQVRCPVDFGAQLAAGDLDPVEDAEGLQQRATRDPPVDRVAAGVHP